MTSKQASAAFRPPALQIWQNLPIRSMSARQASGDELRLKLLLLTLFLPEGLSFFVGEFRLSVTRVLLIIFAIRAASRYFQQMRKQNVVCIPSDIMALGASAWMILAAVITDGLLGLKAAGITVIEFAGAYFIFRYLLPGFDGSVKLLRFACLLTVLAVAVALLDTLSGKLFTYELVKGLTGYVKPPYERAMAVQSETLFRNGTIRAMGSLEHSILFGAVCAWFGALALCTFPFRVFGWLIAGIAFIGIWVSQAKAPLLGFVIAVILLNVYMTTKRVAARWKVLAIFVGVGLIAIFSFSGSPIATLMKLGGMSPEAAWYRQAIWEAATPLVADSPIFGIGVGDDWDWEAHEALVGSSVDAFWLRAAMMFGIPGAALICLTITSAFWLGPVDRSPYLSQAERRLSVGLGIITTTVLLLGFTVHYWGTCWILVGIFPAIRANLAEAAILHQRNLARARIN
jgi:O-antigen ligase